MLFEIRRSICVSMASRAVEGFLSAAKISVTSAYWTISVFWLQLLVISLTHTRKIMGPSIVPCGTCCLTLSQSDLVPLTHTSWILFVRKSFMNEMAIMLKPKCSSFSHIIMWEMEPKALDKSSAAHAVYKRLLMLSLIFRWHLVARFW